MASDVRFDSKQLTKTQAVFRQVWRKAYREGSVTLTFDRISDAHRFRMGMYGERKKINSSEIDEELGQAMLNCEITAPKELQVTVRTREEGSMVQAALAELRMEVDEVVRAEAGMKSIPGQAQLNASVMKMLSLLNTEEEMRENEAQSAEEGMLVASRPANPYFTRE